MFEPSLKVSRRQFHHLVPFPSSAPRDAGLKIVHQTKCLLEGRPAVTVKSTIVCTAWHNGCFSAAPGGAVIQGLGGVRRWCID